MSKEEIKFRAYLLILNSEFPTHRKTEAMEELLKIYNKQQKEIEVWKETENDYEHELARKDEEIKKQQKEIEKYKNVILNLNNNWVSKEELKNILEKLKDKEREMSDEQGYWGGSELQAKIEILEELLGE